MKMKPDNVFFRVLPRVLFLASLAFMLFSLFKGWNGGIIDLHSFRQTQTALTVKFLLKGGPWLAYETPVLGPPWSIPMEFPLYQWLVALTAKAGFLPLEQSGRLISVLMFLATFYPLYRILKAFGLRAEQICLILALYCLSPQYLFWSRTFMIESTALALSMHFLMFVVLNCGSLEGSGKNRWPLWVAIAIFGALAAMVKVTTFFAFFLAGAGFFFWRWLDENRGFKAADRNYRTLLKFTVCGVLIPVAALFLWTSYADSLKELNPIARYRLTSTAIQGWNFGTLSDKLSLWTWELFFKRTLSDLIGNGWLLVLAITAGFFCRRKRFLIAASLLTLFIIPLAVFTNLHVQHNYYAYANGVFLIVAIGLICSDLYASDSRLKRLAGVTIIGCILGFSAHHYFSDYFPRQGMPAEFQMFKADVDRNIPGRDDIIVVFGAGWSSEIPYYLDRRAVVWNEIYHKGFKELLQNLKPYSIGAVLFYGDARYNENMQRMALAAFGIPFKNMRNYGQIFAYFNE